MKKKLKRFHSNFFVNKYLKNHSSKNIWRRAFCLAPNEREILNLLTLIISMEALISGMRCPTFPYENQNPISPKYVKKSKADFFPDKLKKKWHGNLIK